MLKFWRRNIPNIQAILPNHYFNMDGIRNWIFKIQKRGEQGSFSGIRHRCWNKWFCLIFLTFELTSSKILLGKVYCFFFGWWWMLWSSPLLNILANAGGHWNQMQFICMRNVSSRTCKFANLKWHIRAEGLIRITYIPKLPRVGRI